MEILQLPFHIHLPILPVGDFERRNHIHVWKLLLFVFSKLHQNQSFICSLINVCKESYRRILFDHIYPTLLTILTQLCIQKWRFSRRPPNWCNSFSRNTRSAQTNEEQSFSKYQIFFITPIAESHLGLPLIITEEMILSSECRNLCIYVDELSLLAIINDYFFLEGPGYLL